MLAWIPYFSLKILPGMIISAENRVKLIINADIYHLITYRNTYHLFHKLELILLL